MKNIMKRVLSSVLCLVMIISLLPTTVFAASEQPNMLEVNDGYMKVTVSTKNGGFLIDTVTGDKLDKADDNKNLLFPASDFDTSYTSFQVTRAARNGGTTTEEYIFGRSYGFLGLSTKKVEVTKEGNSIVAIWGVEDFTVKQTLTLLDETASLHGMVNISYTFSTESDDILDVKMRVMYDTALGFQDYATYEVPNRLNEYSHVIKETVIDNSGENAGDNYSGTLFAVDDVYSPSVTAYAVDAVLDGRAVSPYQLAFGHWNNLASSIFDFVPGDITFTNALNREFMTADSAFAMYYDLGELEKAQEKSFSTYYGIYSNATVDDTENVAINFPVFPTAMELKEDDSNAYISQVAGGSDGDIHLKMMLENISGTAYEKVSVVVETMNEVYPYADYLYFPDQLGAEGGQFTQVIQDFKYGEEVVIDAYFNVKPLIISEYRRFRVSCYNTSNGNTLTSQNLIGSREFYLFCPGELGDSIIFNTIDPGLIYYEGIRNIYLTGLNFGMLKDTTAYAAILRPVNGGEDVVIPATNVVVDDGNGTINLVVDEQMSVGTYHVIFDWVDPTKEDATSELLRVQVTDDLTKVSPTYGVVTIEKAPGFTDKNPVYQIGMYRTEQEYKKAFTEKERVNKVYLEFRGDFGVRRENGQIVEVRANSLTDIYGKPLSTINISNCLDVECGSVALMVENAGEEDQIINVDIDGKVYTTNARTSVWDGVCAITSFENGNLNTMLEYNYEGEACGDVENSVSNTNGITLLWPGAASTAQTIAGMFFEFRYCQFGYMALEKGEVTEDTPRMRIISFGAELSPDFLMPSNFDWGARQTSTMEAAQLALAKTNYTASQLRDVQDRFAADQKLYEDSERASLQLYVHDIFFGGGFVGFNTSVELELPEYFDVIPSVEGKLDLKVLPANLYRDGRIWEFGVAGTADMLMVSMSASFSMKETPAGFPAFDSFYLEVEGGYPGIPVDPYGCFWIVKLGGGMSNIYDTMFVVSKVPPMALTLTTGFRIFQALEATASVTASMRSFSATMSNVKVLGVKVMDELGVSAQWYPELKLRGQIKLSIMGIIKAGGYIVIERNKETNDMFWEAFATGSVHTPDLIIIPSIEVGSVDLGINDSKIWGALHVLKLDMGVTYYWGGDVDFAFGKYDAPESTYPLAVMAVGEDPETGRVLYMRLGTNATMVAGSNQQTGITRESKSGVPASVESTVDGMTHRINLGTYDAAADMLLTMNFSAETREAAEQLAMGGGIVFTDEASDETYQLIWLDAAKPADEQPNANAMFAYNEETKKATVSVSFTDSSAYGKNWVLKTEADTVIGLFTLDKLPGLDTVTYTVDGNELTVDSLTGYEVETLGEVAVYAVDAEGTVYPIGSVNAQDPAATALELPSDLPTGTYSVQVVVNNEDENICSSATAEGTFTYVNPLQPEAPEISGIQLGGDYSVDVDINASGDGYLTTIYEQDGENWIPVADFSEMIVEADEGVLPTTLTLGGSYTTVNYVDDEGNSVSAEEAAQKIEIVHALEAGKAYRVGVMVYKNDANGMPVYSEEVMTEPVVMVAPDPANVTVKAVGSKSIDAVIDSNIGTVDVITTQNASFRITSDMAVSGTWSLDGGVQTGAWTASNSGTITLPDAVTEGEHALILQGENENGDALRVQYRFRVDCSGPMLQISAPIHGSIFGGSDTDYKKETVLLTGRSEPGTTVTVLVEGAEAAKAVVDATGEFSIPVVLDETQWNQTMKVVATDAAGNETIPREITLTNAITGVEGGHFAIFLNGNDMTDQVIPAGLSGNLEVRYVAGDRSMAIPDDSEMGRQIELSLTMLEGYGTLEGKKLFTDPTAIGLVQATYDNQVVVAAIGERQNAGPHQITLSTGEGYTIRTEESTTVADGGSFSFSVEIAEGYSKLDYFAVTANSIDLTPVDGVYTISDIYAPKIVQVFGVADITAPGITIEVKDNVWKSFLNAITFDLFFKEKQTVNITAEELGSGIASLSYFVSEEALSLETIKTVTTWTDYTDAFTLNPDTKAVIYAKATDNAGNTAYVSSDGLILDATLPVIQGIENGGVYTGEVLVTITDEYLASVTVNGIQVYPAADVENSFVLKPALGQQTVVAVDKAGNSVTYKVTINGNVTFENPFVDVPEGSYYYEPVMWAVQNGITTGATPTTFNPIGSCQRGAVVTFLWRASGSPEPTTTKNPFIDVSESAYFYKAVLWAVEKGITNGTSATEFSPYQNCTRAHVVTFLWRAQNCPEAIGEADFDDVEPGKFYTDAVAWAVENGITNGMGDGTFGVSAVCNRAQVVTFLYRTLVK